MSTRRTTRRGPRFDLGWGAGSIAVGVLVGAVGYGPAFVVTAIAVALVATKRLTRG